jgi:hypothetical protein
MHDTRLYLSMDLVVFVDMYSDVRSAPEQNVKVVAING